MDLASPVAAEGATGATAGHMQCKKETAAQRAKANHGSRRQLIKLLRYLKGAADIEASTEK